MAPNEQKSVAFLCKIKRIHFIYTGMIPYLYIFVFAETMRFSLLTYSRHKIQYGRQNGRQDGRLK